MKPGDMAQMMNEADEIEARAWRSLLAIGISLVLVVLSSMLIGVGLGFLIWGV